MRNFDFYVGKILRLIIVNVTEFLIDDIRHAGVCACAGSPVGRERRFDKCDPPVHRCGFCGSSLRQKNMTDAVEINLRVTGQSSQGGRRYMEDAFVVAYQHTGDKKDLEYAFFGIFDGHGGKEAAQYAKNNLLHNIVNSENFWHDDDGMILKSIRDGFLATHLAMWKEVDNWPKTASGLPSTAGTTASVVFIKKGKLYTGHVGDSRIVLGYKDDSEKWLSECLTRDHKPESPLEKKRIYDSGGLVMTKSGVERVVWKRPRTGHQGPIRRSTDFDKIPFLAVARSLGDLWSYDYLHEAFVVSPEPDVNVVPLDLKKDCCLILASDGLWNIMTPDEAISFIQDVEVENNKLVAKACEQWTLNNPSKVLVSCALDRWNEMRMRADNTSVVIVMFDFDGPSKIEIPKDQLVLKMTFPKSCQVPMVRHRSKSYCSLPNATGDEDSLEKCNGKTENLVESRLGYLQLASKMFEAEKDIKDFCASRENEKDSEHNLQSCSDFLPEYTDILTSKSTRKSDISGIENTCVFPRWSKSASGRTSLLKLATWSKVVSRRRMSDPFPHKNFDLCYCNDDCEKVNKDTTDLSLLDSDGDQKSEELRNSVTETPSESSRTHHGAKNLLEDEKIFKTTLDHFYNIKQAIKRKYPGTEISQSYIGDSLDVEKAESISSQKKKLDLANLNALKAMVDTEDNDA